MLNDGFSAKLSSLITFGPGSSMTQQDPKIKSADHPQVW